MTSPKLAQEQPDGSRLYVHPLTNEKAPSVTTIMKEGIAKPFLTKAATGLSGKYAAENWDELHQMPSWERVEMIRYASDREWQKARDIGTAVHEAAEAWAKGEPHAYSKEISPYMTSFVNFIMEKRPVFLHSEITTWSRKHGYAGTADAICEINGKTYLIDYKTGKRVHPEVAMQLSALAFADFLISPEGKESSIPHIDALAAVHIRPRSWHFYTVANPLEGLAAFLACKRLYDWTVNIAPDILEAA